MPKILLLPSTVYPYNPKLLAQSVWSIVPAVIEVPHCCAAFSVGWSNLSLLLWCESEGETWPSGLCNYLPIFSPSLGFIFSLRSHPEVRDCHSATGREREDTSISARGRVRERERERKRERENTSISQHEAGWNAEAPSLTSATFCLFPGNTRLDSDKERLSVWRSGQLFRTLLLLKQRN